jgi:phosphoserine phosphatase RsbU/P
LRDGERILIEAGGPIVGVLADVRYDERSLALETGDLLLAYTDGISEAMTVEDEEWGEARMVLAAEAARTESAGNILSAVFAAADRFTGNAPQHDAMTLLVIQLG